MPIRGITDTARAAFPRLGKLRKGAEAPRDANGKVIKMGADLTYFRFVSERPEVQAAFEEAYGEKPAQLTVFLPHPTVEENFDCWKEAWVAGGLKHRCDGETMTIWQDKDGTYRRDPQSCTGGCDEVGRLSLWLPGLIKAGFVGFVTLETHGINDLLSIQGSLLAALAHRIGAADGLRGIEWTLRRAKEKIFTPMNGKRVRGEKWLVKLEPAANWVTLQLEVAHNATMMLPAGPPPQLTSGIDEDTGEILDREVTPYEFEQIAEAADAEEGIDRETTPIAEPQDEETSKADLREKIEKLAEARKLTAAQIDKWSQKHCQCSYAELSLDGLIQLAEALQAKAA